MDSYLVGAPKPHFKNLVSRDSYLMNTELCMEANLEDEKKKLFKRLLQSKWAEKCFDMKWRKGRSQINTPKKHGIIAHCYNILPFPVQWPAEEDINDVY